MSGKKLKVESTEDEIQTVQDNDDGEEVEEMPEIDLSSDSEGEDDEKEVSLIVLKRPPLKELTEEVEVPQEEVTMCGTSLSMTNTKEYSGFVKEYIETEGLATILSKERGLVLFNVSSVWLDGRQLDTTTTRSKLQPGTEVLFWDRTYGGDEYSKLSEEKVLRQALAVWMGLRPDRLLKKVEGEEYRARLQEDRKSFLLYVKGEVFLRAALVRVKGEVAGYLTESTGIIEHTDERGSKINIVFHSDDVKIFKKDVHRFGRSVRKVLPVGCLVSVDARRVHVKDVKNVEYQAFVVLAGYWPLTPHPTLLPGGQGSIAPKYELPHGNFTFYYLELGLEKKLARKLIQLRETLVETKGRIQYDWSGTRCIRSTEEFQEWREEMGDERRSNDVFRINPRRDQGPREVLDSFKGGEMEEEDIKKETKKITISTMGRTWYSPDVWEHGGLKLKEEVKDEEATFEDAREAAVAKKVGREDVRAGSEGPAAKRARMTGK